eukprot:1254118-Amphidinium_carterae.2
MLPPKGEASSMGSASPTHDPTAPRGAETPAPADPDADSFGVTTSPAATYISPGTLSSQLCPFVSIRGNTHVPPMSLSGILSTSSRPLAACQTQLLASAIAREWPWETPFPTRARSGTLPLWHCPQYHESRSGDQLC